MTNKILLASILIFIINPFLGMLSIILLKIVVNKREKWSDMLLFIFMTAYACLIQLTRIFDIRQPSDWSMGYSVNFLQVGTTSAYDYIFGQNDPLWNFINFIGYYLNGGSSLAFLNEIAIFTIFLTMWSIFIYWKHSCADPMTLIVSLALIVFFTEYSSNLNNLLRQFFALSIVIYAYVRQSILGKPSWWLLVFASLLHTFAVLFFILFMIKPLYEKINLKSVVKISFIILILYFTVSNIGFFQNVFSNIQLLSYGIDRLMSAGNPSDPNLLDPATVMINGFVLIALAFIVSNSRHASRGMIFFGNILMALMLLSISISTLAPEIMSRIYITRFYLVPFVLPYLLMHFKIFHRVYLSSVLLFFMYRFLLNFDLVRGGGFFPPITELLTYSIFQFIF